jgi:lambda family phage portal protein
MTNWFERAISVFSPSWALSRAKSRIVLDHAQRTAERFRYEGARSGRRTDGWVSGASDANVELMGALVWLRDRSRDLIRNNPYAAKAIEELVGNTVGTGITPQANTGDPELDKLIDQEWPFFAERCDPGGQMDFYGQQALVVRTMAESGESITRFRPRLPQDKLRVPLQLQILEADFLDHARTMGTVNGHIIQGVEFNQIGQRVAYWLYNFHPGGVLILNPRGGILSQPVPADQVMHTYRVLRPGQVRGVPWLAPVMMALRDLDDYADAERVRKKIEACLAAFVIQPESDPTLGNTSTDTRTGNVVEQFEPGMVTYLKNGSDVKMNNPAAAGGYREYKVTELQAISSGTGVPYEQLASDMSNTTYSSWRGGQLGFRNTIEGYRWLSLIPMHSNPTYRRFIDTLVLIGKIPGKAVGAPGINIYGVQWTAPKWESVDPLKDAKAELQRIRTGTETLFGAIAANGGDPRAQLQQIALINETMDKLKIILDCDPRYTNIRGQEQPGDDNPKEPGRQGPATKASADGDEMTFARRRRWESPSRLYLN